MLLDSFAAKALAAVVLLSIEGPNALRPQLPLQIEDRGELWLVKGTPHTEVKRGLQFVQFHVFFRKTDAEILGFGDDGRLILDAEQAKYLRSVMSDEQVSRISTPITVFEPWTKTYDPKKDLYLALLGGLINRPKVAIDYAYVLMQAAGPRFRNIAKDSLKAEERAHVWHVTVTCAPGFMPNEEILSFSRTTGKLLSGGS